MLVRSHPGRPGLLAVVSQLASRAGSRIRISRDSGESWEETEYATAFGIIVAVPAVLMYRHFRRVVDDYLVEMEDQAERLLERVYDTDRSV